MEVGAVHRQSPRRRVCRDDGVEQFLVQSRALRARIGDTSLPPSEALRSSPGWSAYPSHRRTCRSECAEGGRLGELNRRTRSTRRRVSIPGLIEPVGVPWGATDSMRAMTVVQAVCGRCLEPAIASFATVPISTMVERRLLASSATHTQRVAGPVLTDAAFPRRDLCVVPCSASPAGGHEQHHVGQTAPSAMTAFARHAHLAHFPRLILKPLNRIRCASSTSVGWMAAPGNRQIKLGGTSALGNDTTNTTSTA